MPVPWRKKSVLPAGSTFTVKAARLIAVSGDAAVGGTVNVENAGLLDAPSLTGSLTGTTARVLVQGTAATAATLGDADQRPGGRWLSHRARAGHAVAAGPGALGPPSPPPLDDRRTATRKRRLGSGSIISSPTGQQCVLHIRNRQVGVLQGLVA